jgi:hypothetical protein
MFDTGQIDLMHGTWIQSECPESPLFGKFGFHCFREFPRPDAAHSDIGQG